MEPTLIAPSASLHLDIKSLLGGGIHEQLRPKVMPVLDNIKAMAEGEHRTGNGLREGSHWKFPASQDHATLSCFPQMWACQQARQRHTASQWFGLVWFFFFKKKKPLSQRGCTNCLQVL